MNKIMVRRRAYIPPMRSGRRIYGNRMNYSKPVRRRRGYPIVMPLSRNNNAQNINVSTSRGLRFRGRSGSMTSMIRGFASQSVVPTNAGTTTSYYNSYQRPNPGLRYIKKTNAPQHFHVNASLRVEGLTGRQGVSQMELGLLTDLYAMIVTVPGYTDNTQAFLDNVQTEWSFTNQSEATCYMDLYEVTPRYMSAIGETPSWAFNKGLVDAGIGVAGAATLGAMPYMSPAFTTMFKIHKRYRLELAQGQTHRHFSKYQMGYKWNNQLYDIFAGGVAAANEAYNPRTTRFLMMVVSGQALNDSTTKTNVSTASTAVDIVAKTRYTWFYGEPSSTNYKFANFLPTITTESILDIGSGEVETVQAG